MRTLMVESRMLPAVDRAVDRRGARGADRRSPSTVSRQFRRRRRPEENHDLPALSGADGGARTGAPRTDPAPRRCGRSGARCQPEPRRIPWRPRNCAGPPSGLHLGGPARRTHPAGELGVKAVPGEEGPRAASTSVADLMLVCSRWASEHPIDVAVAPMRRVREPWLVRRSRGSAWAEPSARPTTEALHVGVPGGLEGGRTGVVGGRDRPRHEGWARESGSSSSPVSSSRR